MSPLEFSYPTTEGPGYPNIAEAQVKNLKSAFMKTIEDLKEEINKRKGHLDKSNFSLKSRLFIYPSPNEEQAPHKMSSNLALIGSDRSYTE